MAKTVKKLSYTAEEIDRRLSQVMQNVEDLRTNFNKDAEFREAFMNSSYITTDNLNSVLTDYTQTVDAKFATKSEIPSLDGLATETYVNEKIANIIDEAPEALDTLKEIADKLNDDTDAIASLVQTVATKANEADVYNKTTADDKFVEKSKYDELNEKYTTLFNVVYSQSTGDAATALNADYVVNTLSGTNTSVTITEGKLGDVTIPETTKALSVTAPMQDYSTVILSSPKAFTLINTSDEPVNMTIDAPAGTSIPTISLSGDFNNLEIHNGSISAKTGQAPLTATNIKVENDINKNVNISGFVLNDNGTIATTSVPSLGIANNNTTDNAPSTTIDAENSTVTLNKGEWNVLNTNVSDTTLIVTDKAHINTLNVIKGNVLVYDREISNRIDSYNANGYTVEVKTSEVSTGAELNSAMTGHPGIINVNADITRGRIGWGIFASGNYLLDLKGHTVTISDAIFGIKTRNTIDLKIIDSVGGGKLINDKSYMLWAGENTTITIDVPNSTEIIGVTHTLYCEGAGHPHINVLGGTYKMLVDPAATDAETYDVNGHYKYMLNHLDSTFIREGNCFTITGGIFYNFDPSESYAEPGGPVNLLTEGYEAKKTVIDNVDVYEVVVKS